MSRLVIWVAVFMLFGSCDGTPGGEECKTLPDCPISLDMAPSSVDDMYDECEEDMEKKIKTVYLRNETNNNKDFKQAWNESEEYYNMTWANNTLLNKEQIMALHAYTLDDPPLYCDFNNAVRTNKSVYKTEFQYHTLHFFLTTALRTIKPTAEKCAKVFRRTPCKFSKDVLNNQIRLGSFSSSSMGDYPEENFGNQSCFEITTCFGANISQFSEFDEREVLIPPYEIFKVTEIKERSKHNKLPCEVVYTLKSTKTTQSNLNCDLIKKKRLHGFKIHFF